MNLSAIATVKLDIATIELLNTATVELDIATIELLNWTLQLLN